LVPLSLLDIFARVSVYQVKQENEILLRKRRVDMAREGESQVLFQSSGEVCIPNREKRNRGVTCGRANHGHMQGKGKFGRNWLKRSGRDRIVTHCSGTGHQYA